MSAELDVRHQEMTLNSARMGFVGGPDRMTWYAAERGPKCLPIQGSAKELAMGAQQDFSIAPLAARRKRSSYVLVNFVS